MIVLIDNYDSFSYNVYQLIGSVKPDIKVVRNDEVTIKELEAMKPEALILSPGPGKPEDAGICIEGLPETFPAARYHSLAAIRDTLPEELVVTAESEDGEVMALEHKEYSIFGLQFHPESVMTPDGKTMIENFMKVIRDR